MRKVGFFEMLQFRHKKNPEFIRGSLEFVKYLMQLPYYTSLFYTNAFISFYAVKIIS
jgi:hypothetical protein